MPIDEPVILSVDTATRSGSVCLTRGGVLLAKREGDPDASQSNLLLDQIASVLEDADVALRAVDLFAVAIGPGSFTGLRIGIATIKSFGATLERRTIGVPTLHAVAYGAGESTLTIAALPAGRGEVYAQRFTVSPFGKVKPLDAPTHIAPTVLIENTASERAVNWAGEGARVHAEQISARAALENIPFGLAQRASAALDGGHHWTLVINSQPLAVSIAHLALVQAQSGAPGPAADIRAMYVRPSDAEINKRC